MPKISRITSSTWANSSGVAIISSLICWAELVSAYIEIHTAVLNMGAKQDLFNLTLVCHHSAFDSHVTPKCCFTSDYLRNNASRYANLALKYRIRECHKISLQTYYKRLIYCFTSFVAVILPTSVEKSTYVHCIYIFSISRFS